MLHIPRMILPVGLIMLAVTLKGQQGNTFYLMHKVPQSNLLNPAVQLNCKWYVGIPGIASAHVSYANTAFTYNDLAGSDTWNLEGIVDQMHRVDLYSQEVSLHPVSIGYRHRSLYFTFNISEKFHAFQTVPKKLAEITLYGNGPFVGETVRFNAMRPSGHYYREYSFGLSKVLDRYLTLGARAKLLFGKANVHTGRSDMRFNTEENSFNLLLEGDYTLHGSLPVTINQDPNGDITGITLNDVNYVQMLLNRGNPGISIDLGIIYRADERTILSASLLDVGTIRWRTDLNNVNGTGSFVFNGVDPGSDVVSRDFFEEMIDSLLNSFDATVSQLPYFSYIPPQLYLGGSYKLMENLTAGIVNRNVFFRSKVHSSLTLVAQADLADRFLATVSWSYLNNTIQNIGAGMAYHGKGFQFHLVTDNLLGFFFPFDTRTVNLRAGFNLMFGCPHNKREQMAEDAYGQIPLGANCSSAKPGKREKQMQRAARKQNRN